MKQPMLSYSPPPKKPLNLRTLIYPLVGFFKYDGIRASNWKNMYSRRLKLIPNKAIRRKFGWIPWFDGELVVGNPTAIDCYNKTESRVMTIDGSADDVSFYIFDWFQRPFLPYLERRKYLQECKGVSGFKIAPMRWIANAGVAEAFRDEAIMLGYEGIMLRSPDAPYKFGRSTLREQYLLKVKASEDSEATVFNVYPRMHNANKQERDERGYAKRSSHKAGKQATAELGGFTVCDLKTKIVFDAAPGILTQIQREKLWSIKHTLVGKIIKYRFQPSGVVNKPRHPRFIGFRSKIDF